MTLDRCKLVLVYGLGRGRVCGSDFLFGLVDLPFAAATRTALSKLPDPGTFEDIIDAKERTASSQHYMGAFAKNASTSSK
jgi:hypothetical protein